MFTFSTDGLVTHISAFRVAKNGKSKGTRYENYNTQTWKGYVIHEDEREIKHIYGTILYFN